MRRGLVATSAGLFRVPRALPLNVAREMLLTGDPVSHSAWPTWVLSTGSSSGTTVAEAIVPAERIEHNAPTSIRATLTALDAVTEADDAAGWAVTEAALNTILTSEDREEGLAALFERRPPEWPGR